MSMDQSKAERLRREITDLHHKVAKESQVESAASTKAAKARAGADSARSQSTSRSKLREADREESKVLGARQRRAELQRKIASKTTELSKIETKITQRQTQALKDLQAEAGLRARSRRAAVLEDLGSIASERGLDADREYDFFISHASPDKETVARPLAELLRRRGSSVWLDEEEIRVGDSIRERIDAGLARSSYGIVVLSKSFLEGRPWTQRELNALFVREESSGETRILPIWHEVTKDEVISYSPILADKHALKTSDYTYEEIANLLVERLRPRQID